MNDIEEKIDLDKIEAKAADALETGRNLHECVRSAIRAAIEELVRQLTAIDT